MRVGHEMQKNAAWWWNAAQNMHWIIKLGWILYTHDEFASRDNTKKKKLSMLLQWIQTKKRLHILLTVSNEKKTYCLCSLNKFYWIFECLWSFTCVIEQDISSIEGVVIVHMNCMCRHASCCVTLNTVFKLCLIFHNLTIFWARTILSYMWTI